MMTEKQIYRRMNHYYETEFGSKDDDEWYGEDNPHIWRFYRPSEKTTYKMVLDECYRQITTFEKKDTETEYRKVGNYTW